jgi:hypothetical protein
MGKITEAEFRGICEAIVKDRESILKHNPMGSEEETLLWMLLGCLISYLSLSEMETPCFKGTPDANTYREAISNILRCRMEPDFRFSSYFKLFEQE